MTDKPKALTTFFRYNVVALIATVVDFSLFIFLSQVLNVWYVLATFVSAVTGGIVAFILKRNWAFVSKDKRMSSQVIKYIIVWGGSILLNTWGLYLMVEHTSLEHVIAKVIVAVTVGIGFNYVLYKYFVFK